MTTEVANVEPHRRRWMRWCVNDDGRIDWQGYALLTTCVPLRDFLDLEELAQVAQDRKFAWDVYMQQHPEMLANLRARPGEREPSSAETVKPRSAREQADTERAYRNMAREAGELLDRREGRR